MTTTLGFKDLIDLPQWRPLATALAVQVAGGYTAFDLRTDASRDPYVWQYQILTYLQKYNTLNDEWTYSPVFATVGGSLGAGSIAWFQPSHGHSGLCGAGSTSTTIVLPALPNSANANLNQFANNGSGLNGFKIRVKADGAGHSGKTEEAYIIGNTAGTTPTVTLDRTLSFTPDGTDHFEILSGRVYMMSAGASKGFKAFDVATGTISAALTTTNLIGTVATDACCVALDEQYVPYDRLPGEGMIVGVSTYDAGNAKKCLLSTASDGTSITGQATAGDAAVLQNEYRNFQIRIVEDATAPTAVGQRRIITSHTAGASPKYTVATWTVTPTAGVAKFVIENNNDVLLWTSAATVTYSYRAGGFASDGSWSTAAAVGTGIQYANPPQAHAAGCCAESCFSIEPDTGKNARHSHIIWINNVTPFVSYLDIAGGANGVWTNFNVLTEPGAPALTTATCSAHDPVGNQGRYMYININGTVRNYRFDLKNHIFEPWTTLRTTFGGTVVVGGRMWASRFVDGTTFVPFVGIQRPIGVECFNILAQR